MPNYDYNCTSCESLFVLNRLYSERDNNEEVECPECGKKSCERVYASFPGVTRASFIDGNNRFAALKTEAKLRTARAEARPGSKEHLEISTEINTRAKKDK